MSKRKPCPICSKESSKSSVKDRLFTPRGLKQHMTKVHGITEIKSPTTTIEIRRTTHKWLDGKKDWGESFDEIIRRLCGIPEER